MAPQKQTLHYTDFSGGYASEPAAMNEWSVMENLRLNREGYLKCRDGLIDARGGSTLAGAVHGLHARSFPAGGSRFVALAGGRAYTSTSPGNAWTQVATGISAARPARFTEFGAVAGAGNTYAICTTGGGVPYSFNDAGTFAALAAPTVAACGCRIRDRVWCTDGNRTVYYSAAGNGTSFTVATDLLYPPVDNGEIMGIANYNDSALLFCHNGGVLQYDGYGTTDWRVSDYVRNLKVLAGATITPTEEGIYGLADGWAFRLAGDKQDISLRIRGALEDVGGPVYAIACDDPFEQMWYLAYRSIAGGHAYNDKLLVYDRRRGIWYRDTGLYIGAMTSDSQNPASNTRYMVFGDSRADHPFIYQTAVGYDDYGLAGEGTIVTKAQGKAENFGQPERYKKCVAIWWTGKGTNVTLKALGYNDPTTAPTEYTASTNAPANTRMYLPRTNSAHLAWAPQIQGGKDLILTGLHMEIDLLDWSA